jgi:hypothetical protein
MNSEIKGDYRVRFLFFVVGGMKGGQIGLFASKKVKGETHCSERRKKHLENLCNFVHFRG